MLTERELARELLRVLGGHGGEGGLAGFVTRLSPHYSRPDHLAPVVELLEAAEKQPVRAVVACPPRHGKTELLLHAIAWRLARNPAVRIAYVGYSVDFARSKSRRARWLAQAAGVQVLEDASRLEDWRTPAGGGLLATGIGGALTGHGVDLLIADDPVKNRVEAESPRHRQMVWEWWTDVAMTRLEPGASAVVVMTRWHEDDLAGRLVREGWPYVCLPALDAAGRALWPERWPAEELEKIRRSIGEYSWSSLYMGRPVPRGGALFQGVWTYRTLPDGVRYAIGVDWAYSVRSHADYSVAVVMACDGDRYYVADVFRRQVTLPEWLDVLRVVRARYPAASWHSQIGGAEQGIVDLARREGLPIRASKAVADKYIRWQAFAAAWTQGLVLVPERAPWLEPYLDELLSATGLGDEHDDQVDASVAAFDALHGAAEYDRAMVRSERR